jgi:anti-anti-sigma factor
MEIKCSGSIRTLDCDLALTRDHLANFQRLVDQCFGDGLPRLVIDMRSTPLIDSDGLEALLTLKERCDLDGGGVVIARPNPLCEDILRVTGLTGELLVYSDYVEALGSFSR